MAHIFSISHRRMRPASLVAQGLTLRLSKAMDRLKAARDTRRALRQLSYHTDAQLADIGLTREDLARCRFDCAADERAEAISRLYR